MSYRDTVATVNEFQLRKHGHKVSTRVGEFFDEYEENEFVGAEVPTRDPLLSRRLLSNARNDLVVERNGHLLELEGVLPGTARTGPSLETEIKGLMEQLSDLGSIDPSDPVAVGRSEAINKLISEKANKIFALKNVIANLNAKIKDVDNRIQQIDDNERLEKQNVLARDKRRQVEAKDKKELLARQQRELEEAKKRKIAKGPSVPSTPFTPTPPTSTPFGPQLPLQSSTETAEVRESGGGLGLAIGLAVVGTAIAVAANK